MWFSNITDSKKYKVKLKYLKKKSKSYYYSKAPMAHKTRSHEKYLKKTYPYSFVIKINKKTVLGIQNILISFFFINFFFNKITSNLISIKNYKLPLNLKFKLTYMMKLVDMQDLKSCP